MHNSDGFLTPTLGGAACIPASEYIRTSWCIRARAWDFKPMGASVNHLKFLELDDMGEDLQFQHVNLFKQCVGQDKYVRKGVGWERKNQLAFLTHTYIIFA